MVLLNIPFQILENPRILNSRTRMSLVQGLLHLFEVGFILRMSNLCTCLLVLTLSLENKTPSYRILMPVRQRTRWFVLHMLPHWLFITAARYEKRLHPSPTSNEFLHGDSIQGAGISNGLSLKKDRDWAAIIPYYMTELQDWGIWEEKRGVRV